MPKGTATVTDYIVTVSWPRPTPAAGRNDTIVESSQATADAAGVAALLDGAEWYAVATRTRLA